MTDTKLPAFLVKLKSMLNDSSINHIISWNEKGNKFIIHEIKQFKELVLPMYFKIPNYSTFQKQMNNYGFKNIRISSTKTEYYNENWTNDYQKIHKINRKREIETETDSNSKLLSQLMKLKSDQQQLMDNLQNVSQRQIIISQIIYELHLESSKYTQVFQQLIDLQL